MKRLTTVLLSAVALAAMELPFSMPALIAPAAAAEASQASPQNADLAAAEAAFRKAKAEEKRAKEELDLLMAEARRAETKAASEAQTKLAAWDQAQQNLELAKGEAVALLEQYAAIQIRMAQVRALAGQAQRVYEDALPIYQIRARHELLYDNPVWRAIERRASDTAAELRRVVAVEQPKLEDVERRLKDKRAELGRLQNEANRAAALPPADPAGEWLKAGLAADTARVAARDAEAAVVKAFDAYVARVGTTRPPFLEAVTATAGSRPLYDSAWHRDKSIEDANQQRRRDIRAALSELEASISERERERTELRQQRLVIAEEMQPISAAIVYAGQASADAEFNKILYAAAAHVAGTVVETVLTGGIGPALSAAEAAAEKAVEEVAKKQLARQAVRAMEPEAAQAMGRLVQSGEHAIASEGARVYKELVRLVHEGAMQEARRTGEPLEHVTRDALERLARALRSLTTKDPLLFKADPVVINEMMQAAKRATSEKTREISSALVQAPVSKLGPHWITHAMIEGGSSASDVASVLVGDLLEQGLGRSTAYAFSVSPSAMRTAIDAARANAGRWQQVRSGTVTFVKSGWDFKKFKGAFGGTTRGNLVALGTTALRAAFTKHFADQQYAWAAQAAKWDMEWSIRHKMLAELMVGDREISGGLAEARRLQAELLAYLAVLESPRRLDTTVHDVNFPEDTPINLVLRFSTAVPAPKATLGGRVLKFEPVAGGAANAAALWKATLSRRELPRDAKSASLVVSVPGAPFDSDPATPARPDPSTPTRIEAGRAVVGWQGLDAGEDSHHAIPLSGTTLVSEASPVSQTSEYSEYHSIVVDHLRLWGALWPENYDLKFHHREGNLLVFRITPTNLPTQGPNYPLLVSLDPAARRVTNIVSDQK